MSLRKIAKINQRVHRDRPQPESRAEFGYLEHKKDWIKRARVNEENKKQLEYFRRRALERNPDEFDHHMINSRLQSNGIHRELSPFSDDETLLQQQFEGTRDLQYVQHKLSVERKKIEKLKADLHLADDNPEPINKHMIFVDEESEAKTFDPAAHFNTDVHLLGRKHNRLTKDAIEKRPIAVPDTAAIKAAAVQRRAMYKELRKRVERERELTIVLQKLQLKKDLGESRGSQLKPVCVQKGTPTQAAVYKWQYDRKK